MGRVAAGTDRYAPSFWPLAVTETGHALDRDVGGIHIIERLRLDPAFAVLDDRLPKP